MSIHVTCSNCLKRFKVALRFAGMTGPCPNCAAIISIPNDTVKIHGQEGAETEPPKEAKQRVFSQPIQQLDIEWNLDQIKYSTLGLFGVLLLTFLLGCMPMYAVVRLLFGILGLSLIAFPLVLFGYHLLRDREQIFAFSGMDLYRRAGIAAAGYVILWIVLESFLAVMHAGVMLSCLYLAAFAVLAALLAYPLLELRVWDALLHFCLFAVSVIILRFLLGLGWLWQSSELIRRTAVPPPPYLPGM